MDVMQIKKHGNIKTKPVKIMILNNTQNRVAGRNPHIKMKYPHMQRP